MNKSELQKVLNALMERNNPKYTSPSGAFIELLREHALKDEIEKIAECCKVYFEHSPESKNYVSKCIPAILANNLFTIRQDLNFEKFISWSVETENWGSEIISNSTNPVALRETTEKIISTVNTYLA